MKIINRVDVQPTTLTFENNASLVQANNPDPANPLTQNSGNITYIRTTPIKDTDYVYWSSPVAGAKLAAIKQLLYTIRLTLSK
jgi:hypothetical protein